jgi:hypothetical protein
MKLQLIISQRAAQAKLKSRFTAELEISLLAKRRPSKLTAKGAKNLKTLRPWRSLRFNLKNLSDAHCRG